MESDGDETKKEKKGKQYVKKRKIDPKAVRRTPTRGTKTRAAIKAAETKWAKKIAKKKEIKMKVEKRERRKRKKSMSPVGGSPQGTPVGTPPGSPVKKIKGIKESQQVDMEAVAIKKWRKKEKRTTPAKDLFGNKKKEVDVFAFEPTINETKDETKVKQKRKRSKNKVKADKDTEQS